MLTAAPEGIYSGGSPKLQHILNSDYRRYAAKRIADSQILVQIQKKSIIPIGLIIKGKFA
jgi:hypothetical protein